MRPVLVALALASALGAPVFATTPDKVVRTCADIALASHEDSLTTARTLQVAVAKLPICRRQAIF